ncbi:MAG: DUF5895 domain-containing protein [Pseudomonadota bacterium]
MTSAMSSTGRKRNLPAASDLAKTDLAKAGSTPKNLFATVDYPLPKRKTSNATKTNNDDDVLANNDHDVLSVDQLSALLDQRSARGDVRSPSMSREFASWMNQQLVEPECPSPTSLDIPNDRGDRIDDHCKVSPENGDSDNGGGGDGRGAVGGGGASAVVVPVETFSEFEKRLEKQQEENLLNVGRAGMKVINHPQFLGLWVANDNVEKMEVTDLVKFHSMSREYSITTANDETITGRLFQAPRIAILTMSPLLQRLNAFEADCPVELKQDNAHRMFCKDDANARFYQAYRSYLLFLFDDDNVPLHTVPVQLTTKRAFSPNFFSKYGEFIKTAFECMSASNSQFKNRKFKSEPVFNSIGSKWWKNNEPSAWEMTRFIFCPIFGKGKSNNASKTCSYCDTVGFQTLTPENVTEYRITDPNILKEFHTVFIRHRDWWQKPLKTSPTTTLSSDDVSAKTTTTTA